MTAADPRPAAGGDIAAAHLQTPAEALRQDASQYADRYHLEIAVAEAQLEALDASVIETDRLAGAYRDRLAGIFVEHEPTLRIVVLLAGTWPPAPDAPLQVAGIPIEYRPGAAASREQIVAAIVAHQAELMAALPSPPGLGVDARTGRLAAMVQPGEIATEGADALAARLGAIAGVPVELHIWGEHDADASVAGGGRLVGRDGDTGPRYVCTAGFVVTDGERTGVATAAHCPDAPDLIDPGGGRIATTLIGAWGARYQDVQIQAVPVLADPAFYVDRKAGVARDVATWRNRMSLRVGDLVCHRGEHTGYSCSEIVYVDYAPAGDLCAGPCAPTWVAVEGPHCGGGDSGGPVFIGGTALGIFKGGSYAADGACAVWYFMSTDYLPAGWRVLRAGEGLLAGPAP